MTYIMVEMLDTISRILRQECKLQPGAKLLVGVSGGPDSLSLLDILARLGTPIVVGHLDHSLRNESAGEAEKVVEFARQLGASIHVDKVDVRAYQKNRGLSLEEAAREARYRFLFNVAQAEGVQAVAVGHTADDQVETFLMHLLRGAGLDGLRGMGFYSLPNPWSGTIPLIRPLLSTWREQIIEYCVERGLQPTFDPSNLDTRFYRNRLRHELLPYLDSLNHGARQRLLRTSYLLSEDYALIHAEVETAWRSCIRLEGPDYLAFKLQRLLLQPVALTRHILRKVGYLLRPKLRDVDYQDIQHALVFLQKTANPRQMDWMAGIRLLVDGDLLWVAGWEVELPDEHGQDWPQIPAGQQLRLPVPGKLEIRNGWRLETTMIEMSPETLSMASKNSNPFHAWLDGEIGNGELWVRARKPGERMQPLGMDGHTIKVSDLMVNGRLPQRARSAWPILLKNEQIVWIPGLRIAHQYRLQEMSTSVVHVSLRKYP